MDDSWGNKVLNWLMEGPECGNNRGANPRASWGWMEPYKEEILAQPWMDNSNAIVDRVHATDPEALLGYLVTIGAMSEEERELFLARRTLMLMEE